MEKRKAAVKKEEDAAAPSKVVKKDVKKDVQAAKKEADGASNKVKKEADGVSNKVKKEVGTAASSETKMQNMKSKSSKSSDAKAVTKKDHGISKATAVQQVKTAKKEEVETKSVKVVKTRTVTTTTKVEKKKSYDLPGQKHDPPEERDPQRIFYESLREQIPSSEMAEVWLMEHGLLPEDEAKAAYDKRQKQKKPSGTPVKPSSSKVDNHPPPAKVAEANGKSRPISKTGKSKREDSSDDDDFILKPKKKLKS